MNKFVKAKELADSGKVVFEGLVGSSLYFKVISTSEHQVIFRITTNRWLCNCEYFSIKSRDCSHILACKYWLLKNEKELDNE